ncbi:sel1 repeat family protein [Pseudoxanthomonas daejeonensis]|uniref:sel1 repeat family protein n=1 Tax=Pseudoxanthomonas daejeonensis TaxID=266062 RepID=UPI001390A19A|nr:sel1 repeat family protein [Pseudoxanthomonas daejeonensis]
MRIHGWVVYAGLLCGVASGVAHAGSDDASIDRDDQQVMSTIAFLDAHPDLKYRREGWLAFEAGDYATAIGHFTKAARFGDKMSQAMLAEMAWKGQGQTVDRPLGYAWADLAAERGYRQFVALREHYWGQLTPQERERAIEVGQPLLPLYSQEVTQVTMSKHLRKARRYMIAGRVSRGGDVYVPGVGGLWTKIRGHDFYAEKFWNPQRYQEWTDQVWKDPPRENVDVGEPTTIPGRQ